MGKLLAVSGVGDKWNDARTAAQWARKTRSGPEQGKRVTFGTRLPRCQCESQPPAHVATATRAEGGRTKKQKYSSMYAAG